MPQTGFTPIQLYSSSTSANTPAAGNLTNDTKGSELAVNIADGKLFYKDTSNNVQTLADKNWVGTVTNVSALTIGTTGTDLSSTVANPTSTPVITLNVPTASASNRGALSNTDWSTFNNKQAALISGTNIKTVSGTTLLGSGDLGTIGTSYGGTGVTSFGGTNTLLYTTSANTLSSIATANTSTLVTNSSGAPAWTSGTTANRVLRTDGTTVSFSQVALATDVSGVLPVANSLLYYNTGVKSMSSGSGNVDWFSIDFGNFSGRSARVEVVFSLISGGGGSRIWFRNSLVVETGGASLSETNLNANSGGNGSLSFVLSGATLTVRTTSSIGSSEDARMSILVSGRDMTSARISVL